MRVLVTGGAGFIGLRVVDVVHGAGTWVRGRQPRDRVGKVLDELLRHGLLR
jgi:nucleoside-diphosphate-sugar epimerase